MVGSSTVNVNTCPLSTEESNFVPSFASLHGESVEPLAGIRREPASVVHSQPITGLGESFAVPGLQRLDLHTHVSAVSSLLSHLRVDLDLVDLQRRP